MTDRTDPVAAFGASLCEEQKARIAALEAELKAANDARAAAEARAKELEERLAHDLPRCLCGGRTTGCLASGGGTFSGSISLCTVCGRFVVAIYPAEGATYETASAAFDKATSPGALDAARKAEVAQRTRAIDAELALHAAEHRAAEAERRAGEAEATLERRIQAEEAAGARRRAIAVETRAEHESDLEHERELRRTAEQDSDAWKRDLAAAQKRAEELAVVLREARQTIDGLVDRVRYVDRNMPSLPPILNGAMRGTLESMQRLGTDALAAIDRAIAGAAGAGGAERDEQR